MIFDSTTWKADLANRVKAINARLTQSRWPSRSLVLLEQDIFLGAYITRKLNESGKLPDSTWKLSIPCHTSRRRESFLSTMNWHRLHDHYDLSNFVQSRLPVSDLCNWLIHSFVFVLDHGSINNRGFKGIYLNSDRSKSNGIWHIDARDIVQFFGRVANDDIWQLKVLFSKDDSGRSIETKSALGYWDDDNVDNWQWMSDISYAGYPEWS